MKKFKIFFLIVIVVFSLSNCTTNDGYLYKIFKDGKYGFIDSIGNEVIKPQYILALGFSDGLALVVTDTSIIYPKPTAPIPIDKIDFKSIKKFNGFGFSNLDTLIEFKYGYININNKMVINNTYSLRSKFSKFSKSIVDQNLFVLGKYMFYDGLALFKDSTNKYGFIDKKGSVTIKPIYEDAKNFSDGLAAICIFDSLKHSNKWGYIDVKGTIVLEPKYDEANDFLEGLAFVFLSGTDFSKSLKDNPEGNVKLNYNWLLINKNGKLIGEPLNALFSNPYGFYDGISIVESKFFFKHVGFRFMDINGKYTTDFDIENVTIFGNGYAGVKSKEGWLFVDKKMNIKSAIYENVQRFQEGIAPIKENGQWGYIDTTFKKVIDNKFDTCTNFNKGIARVRMTSQSLVIEGLINKKGDFIWQNEFYDNNR